MSTTTERRTTAFRKVVRPGTVPTYDGGLMSVFCKIELAEDGRLSISGVEGPKANGDAVGSCGQIDMHYAHRNAADDDRRTSAPTRPEDFTFAPGWDAERWLDFLDVWARWHLNDMRPACEHQRALGWVEASREEIALYHWRLGRETVTAQHGEQKRSLEALQAGEQVSLDEAAQRLLGLPYTVTTATDEAPAPEYEPDGLSHRGAREVKTRGWVRPSEHPDGLLTAPCPDCGFEYGSAWRREDVPADVVAFLLGLPDADRAPAWV